MNVVFKWSRTEGSAAGRLDWLQRQSQGVKTQRFVYYYIYFTIHRPKHPLKVHVWAGISMQGRTSICIFDGIMKKELFVEILNSSLLPSIHALYPNGHRLMQDNDPKHTSGYASQWMVDHGVNWWKTPPESPDINPIENLWHELKEYIRREVKPKVCPPVHPHV